MAVFESLPVDNAVRHPLLLILLVPESFSFLLSEWLQILDHCLRKLLIRQKLTSSWNKEYWLKHYWVIHSAHTFSYYYWSLTYFNFSLIWIVIFLQSYMAWDGKNIVKFAILILKYFFYIRGPHPLGCGPLPGRGLFRTGPHAFASSSTCVRGGLVYMHMR